jgi:hypothetical protein
VELDNVSLPRDAQRQGAELQAPRCAKIPPQLPSTAVRTFVQHRTFRRVQIVIPDSLQEDEGRPSLTEDHVLQR